MTDPIEPPDANRSWVDRLFGPAMLAISATAFGLAWRFGFF